MQVPFPARLQYLAEGRKTCRLLAGTFSMSGEQQRILHQGSTLQRSFSEYKMRFRWMENGEVVGDFDICTGTMDPRQLTQGNQLIMLVVDVAKSTNILQEYQNFAAKRADGETIPIALWAPDGGSGRYMFEREVFYLDPWAKNKQSSQQFYIIIGVTLLLAMLIACVLPCLIFLIPIPVAMFAMRKLGRATKGNQVSTSEYFSIVQSWIDGLISDGTMHRLLLSSMGISTGDGGRL